MTRTRHQIADDRRRFAELQAARMKRVRLGAECAECGETERIEDNGETGPTRTWRCQRCGCQWDRSIGREDER